MRLRHQISLALNILLAVLVMALILRKSERPPAPAAAEAGSEKAMREAPVLVKPPNAPQYSDIASASDRRRWIADQLRAAGVPNPTLVRVIQADLDEDWDKRLEALAQSGKGDADSVAALQQERERDEDAQMRAALGEEGYRQWDQDRMLREANLGRIQLTASETNAIYDLKKNLQHRRWALEQARLNGEMDDAEVNDAYDKSYSEFNQQMKSLLGEERYAQSQGLDEGTAAANLRKDLAKVNPSDSQFQDLLKAQQQWNERRSTLDQQFQDAPSSAAYADQIRALDEARDQEYRRVLGTNAFDTLEKAQDMSYSQMKKCEGLWGLDDTKIDSVYGAIKYYEKNIQDYQAQARALEAQGQNVDWDAVNRNLQLFAEQTQQALQSYLGQDSYDKIRRNGVFPFQTNFASTTLQAHNPPVP